MRALIVDDEPPMRRLLRAWVADEGADTVEAGSAEEALTQMGRPDAPGVAFCDLRLPGHDGLWLAERLRVVHPETAVVVTTGVHEFEAAVQSLRAGAVDYVSKPYARERFVQALQQAFATHHARRAAAALHAELAERRTQVVEALAEAEANASSALEAILGLLQARDPGACEHARRVAKLAVDLAMAVEIGEPELSDIERGALLHDVGRLAMPDALLRRAPGDLTDEERVHLRSYPLHGHAMLKNVPFLATASEIAVGSHERCDGSGFPLGLTAARLPLTARIVAVADAYDELVAGIRSEAVRPARALDILATAHAGKFDPAVIGALAKLQPTGPPS